MSAPAYSIVQYPHHNQGASDALRLTLIVVPNTSPEQIAANVIAIVGKWDPYPFILLNLFLSTMAAFQAPVILMSQNRVAERDRAKAAQDLAVDRKAESEIRDMQEDLEEIKRMIRRLSKEGKE